MQTSLIRAGGVRGSAEQKALDNWAAEYAKRLVDAEADTRAAAITGIQNGTTTINPTLGNSTSYGNINLGAHSMTLNPTVYSGYSTLEAMAAAIGQGGGSVTVDSALSGTSTNPVQNKVITKALNGTTAITPKLGSGTTYGNSSISDGLSMLANISKVAPASSVYIMPDMYITGEVSLDYSTYGYSTLEEMAAAIGQGGGSVTVDSALSTTSPNPVQNQVIAKALNGTTQIKPDLGSGTKILGGDFDALSLLANIELSFTTGMIPLSYYEIVDTVKLNTVMLDSEIYGYSTLEEMAAAIGQGGGSITVDSALSGTSTNPVQNKVITKALNGTTAITPQLGNDTQYGNIDLGNHTISLSTTTYKGYATLAEMATALAPLSAVRENLGYSSSADKFTLAADVDLGAHTLTLNSTEYGYSSLKAMAAAIGPNIITVSNIDANTLMGSATGTLKLNNLYIVNPISGATDCESIYFGSSDAVADMAEYNNYIKTGNGALIYVTDTVSYYDSEHDVTYYATRVIIQGSSTAS